MTPVTRSRIACLIAGVLAAAPLPAAAQQSRAATRDARPASLGIHGFSVVLVIGSMQGQNAGDGNVPESAKKALSDMKDFLPYKRYQLLDAAWMLCCAAAQAGVSGRVRGPNEVEYTYMVNPLMIADSKLNVRFSMREARDAAGPAVNTARLSETARLEHSRQLYDAIRERDEAALRLRSVKQRHDVGMVSAPDMEAATLRHLTAAQRVEDLQRLAGGGAKHADAAARTVMDTTFAIAPGETVVVGTSRLHGDQALIAILTAATKPGAAR